MSRMKEKATSHNDFLRVHLCMVELMTMLESALPTWRFIVVKGIEQLLTMVSSVVMMEAGGDMTSADIDAILWRHAGTAMPVLTPGASRAIVAHLSPTFTGFAVSLMRKACTVEAAAAMRVRRRFACTRVFLSASDELRGHYLWTVMTNFGSHAVTSAAICLPPFPSEFDASEVDMDERIRRWYVDYDAVLAERARIALPIRWGLAQIENSRDAVIEFCSMYGAQRDIAGSEIAQLMPEVLRALAAALDSTGARAMSPDGKERLLQPVIDCVYLSMLFSLVARVAPSVSAEHDTGDIVVDDTRTGAYAHFRTLLDACVAMPAWSTLSKKTVLLEAHTRSCTHLWGILLVSGTGANDSLNLYMDALKAVLVKCPPVQHWLRTFFPQATLSSVMQPRQIADASVVWASALCGRPRSFAMHLVNQSASLSARQWTRHQPQNVAMILASLYWAEHSQLRQHAKGAGGGGVEQRAAATAAEDEMRLFYRPLLGQALGFKQTPAWLLPPTTVLPLEETHLVSICYISAPGVRENVFAVPLIVPRSMGWPALLVLRDSVPLMAQLPMRASYIKTSIFFCAFNWSAMLGGSVFDMHRMKMSQLASMTVADVTARMDAYLAALSPELDAAILAGGSDVLSVVFSPLPLF